MNYNKYIILSIQDLATSNFIHEVAFSEDDYYILSPTPLMYAVSSHSVSSLIEAKEILDSACNSIYSVPCLQTEELFPSSGSSDEYDVEQTPAYINNFVVYNLINYSDNYTSSDIVKQIKKLPKRRFQVVETFANILPANPLAVYAGD